MSALKIVIAGAGGRMGLSNVRAVVAHPDAVLHGAFDRPGAEGVGKDAAGLAGLEDEGITVVEDMQAALTGADAVLDFTTPPASVALAKEAAARGLIHVIGTTGFSSDEDAAIAAAGRDGARIVKSGNMSLGVNLLSSLVRQAAKALGPEFDIEILEMHHRMKVDAPSGTALILGEAAAEGRNLDLESHSVRARDGYTGAREEGSIGFATLRGGTVVGEHSTIFAGPSERITLSHVAEDRAIFSNGAVRAALWAADQSPGLYSMTDVLGLPAS